MYPVSCWQHRIAWWAWRNPTPLSVLLGIRRDLCTPNHFCAAIPRPSPLIPTSRLDPQRPQPLLPVLKPSTPHSAPLLNSSNTVASPRHSSIAGEDTRLLLLCSPSRVNIPRHGRRTRVSDSGHLLEKWEKLFRRPREALHSVVRSPPNFWFPIHIPRVSNSYIRSDSWNFGRECGAEYRRQTLLGSFCNTHPLYAHHGPSAHWSCTITSWVNLRSRSTQPLTSPCAVLGKGSNVLRRILLEDCQISVYLFVQEDLYVVLAIFTIVDVRRVRVREAAALSFPPPSGFSGHFMRGPRTESRFVYRNAVYLLPARDFSDPVEFRISYFRD